jgi:hypothetical protein
MRLLGVEKVEDLGLQHVSEVGTARIRQYLTLYQINTRVVEQQIYDGPSGLDRLRAKL